VGYTLHLSFSPLDRDPRVQVVSKAIQMMRSLARNETEYAPFYANYANSVKLGVVEDARNRAKLASLLRYPSTHATDKLTSLDEYLERMRKGQKGIFFLAGSDVEQMRKSPYLEALAARGYEVLLMADGFDTYVVNALTEYDGVKLVDVGKGQLDFGDEGAFRCTCRTIDCSALT